MSRWLQVRSRHDPFWDLEGPVARREWRYRRLRRTQAFLAWLDLSAVSALVILGPHSLRLAFIH